MICVCTVGVGGARQALVAGFVSQRARLMGRLAAPVSAETVMKRERPR